MSNVTRRQLLAGSAAAIATSIAGCMTMDGEIEVYEAKAIVVDGADDDLGCLDSVSVVQEPADRFLGWDEYSAELSLSSDIERASIVAEWSNSAGRSEAGRIVSHRDNPVIIDVGQRKPQYLRLAVSCSGDETVDAVFEVNEQ